MYSTARLAYFNVTVVIIRQNNFTVAWLSRLVKPYSDVYTDALNYASRLSGYDWPLVRHALMLISE